MHDVYTINIMQLSKYTTQHPLGMQEILVSFIIDMTQRGVSFCHCDCLSIVFPYNTADCTLSVTHNVSGKNMFNKMHIYAIPGTCFFFFKSRYGVICEGFRFCTSCDTDLSSCFMPLKANMTIRVVT